ncbi:MAG: YegS/Rv2252/BmrU family lipid kinase [bacterium]
MNSRSIHIILNPASAGGKTASKKKEISTLATRYVGSGWTMHCTDTKGHAEELTKEVISTGAGLIIVVGGDGTIHEVLNGLMTSGRDNTHRCELGIISSGTGHGFAQSIGLPLSLEDQFALIAGGRARWYDAAKIEYTTASDTKASKYFINECQLGIGGSVVKRVGTQYKRLGGSFGFGLGTIQSVFSHKNQLLTLTSGTYDRITDSFTGVVIANGAFTGGGMNLAPYAQPDDGILDIVMMRDLSILQRLSSFPRIYSGSHVACPWFSYRRSTSLHIESPEKVLIEADGELLGTTPCTVEVVPSALQICCPN